MANRSLFGSSPGRHVPVADTKNSAGGLAYELTHEMALAQVAFTGTFNDTFYKTGQDQIQNIRHSADLCPPVFVAQCAIAAREKGYMKDMPAALLCMLSKADPALMKLIFHRVIDNGRQLRTFVQMMRSGVFGRKSLGTAPKRLVKEWFERRSDYSIFRASVGKSPSLADIIKMVHPKPSNPSRQALYAYLIGKEHKFEDLPEIVQHYERFKQGDRTGGVPNVEFRMLTSLPLTQEDWGQLARNGWWHQTRMNLNSYARHGVFDLPGLMNIVAEKLVDEETIRKSKVFPYQLLAAYVNTGPVRRTYWGRVPPKDGVTVPAPVRNALQDALEIAVDNVPAYEGSVAVIVDTSGSMQSPVTGHRPGATTKVTCVDVAALVGATVMRKNPNALVVPVDTQVHSTDFINPRDSIMTNAERLASLGGGGTDLGAAMQFIEKKMVPDLIIQVSDNESWHDTLGRRAWRGTSSMEIFNRLQAKNPKLKMVNLDIHAGTTSQTAPGNPSILMLGGFSDEIFNSIDRFVRGVGPAEFVEEIKAIDLVEG